ncbi:MAG TPA: hypothetical protein VED87_04290, partial [Methylocystis sp.]|nr:hypothetical protein [Methylocystis sp.]
SSSTHWSSRFGAIELGRAEVALTWLERAVAEKEKGDVHGRVEKTSLQTSVQAVIDCLVKLGRNSEAGQWRERG